MLSLIFFLFCFELNEPLKSKLIWDGPRGSLCEFLDYVLLLIGYPFTVGETVGANTVKLQHMQSLAHIGLLVWLSQAPYSQCSQAQWLPHQSLFTSRLLFQSLFTSWLLLQRLILSWNGHHSRALSWHGCHAGFLDLCYESGPCHSSCSPPGGLHLCILPDCTQTHLHCEVLFCFCRHYWALFPCFQSCSCFCLASVIDLGQFSCVFWSFAVV